MGEDFLPFSPPNLGEEEISEVVDTLRSEWITTGPKVRKFEKEFARFVGAPVALALNSCTAAMHVGLVAIGIGPGDEIITTTMTFAATVNVIEHVGARPVLVDVEPDTLNLSPAEVEKAVTPRTRVIMPVHYAGHPCDMHTIMEIARRHNLLVLEDAAHAVAAAYRGKKVGAIGDLTAFSFYATKNLTTAEGGMLTGSPEVVERARVLSLHGMSRDAWKRYEREGTWFYEILYPGFKYNMTDIQASLGLQQLRRLPAFQARRRVIAVRYNEALSRYHYFQVPVERPEVEHAWHLYPLRLNLDTLRIDRGRFIEELKKRHIGTSVHFIPVHLHPYYRDKYGYCPEDFPTAYGNYMRLVSLPLHPGLTDRDVDRVVEAVVDVAETFRADPVVKP